MKNKVKLWNIVLEVYRELYKQAEPSVDFDALWKITGNIAFFEYFYLDLDRQMEIMEKIMKEYKCTKAEKDIIHMEVLLGASPSSIKKDV